MMGEIKHQNRFCVYQSFMDNDYFIMQIPTNVSLFDIEQMKQIFDLAMRQAQRRAENK